MDIGSDWDWNVEVDVEEVTLADPLNDAVYDLSVDGGVDWRHILRDWDGYPVESSRPDHVEVRVLAAAAPNVPGCLVEASFEVEASTHRSLAVTLNSLGVEQAVKVTLKQEFKIACAAGESRVLSLMIPSLREVRLVRFAPGGELFPFERTIPLARKAGVGIHQSNVDVDTLLSKIVDRSVLWSESGNLSEKRSKQIAVSSKFDVGVSLSKAGAIGVSAAVEGVVTTTVETSVPAGRFELCWIGDPAGAALRTTTQS